MEDTREEFFDCPECENKKLKMNSKECPECGAELKLCEGDNHLVEVSDCDEETGLCSICTDNAYDKF